MCWLNGKLITELFSINTGILANSDGSFRKDFFLRFCFNLELRRIIRWGTWWADKVVDLENAYQIAIRAFTWSLSPDGHFLFFFFVFFTVNSDLSRLLNLSYRLPDNWTGYWLPIASFTLFLVSGLVLFLSFLSVKLVNTGF